MTTTQSVSQAASAAAAAASVSAPPALSQMLEASIPASLAVAAAICWVDPQRFPAVFFLFCGLGFLFRDPLIEVMTRPIAVHISESATKTAEELLGNQDRFDRILSAGTEAIQHAMGSGPLRQTLKNAIVDSTQDEDLENVVLATVTKAIIKATKDESMLDALAGVAKQGLLEALRDKEFMKDSVSSLVEAILAAVKDPELKAAFMVIVTESVSTALQDEQFVAIFRRVMKDVLSDGSMYRAGASGLIEAILPGRSSTKATTDSGRTTSTGTDNASSKW